MNNILNYRNRQHTQETQENGLEEREIKEKG